MGHMTYYKMGCAFPMVISSDIHMGKHRDDDHEEDAPYFISHILCFIWIISYTQSAIIYKHCIIWLSIQIRLRIINGTGEQIKDQFQIGFYPSCMNLVFGRMNWFHRHKVFCTFMVPKKIQFTNMEGGSFTIQMVPVN